MSVIRNTGAAPRDQGVAAPNAAMGAGASRRERDDDYARIIVRLNDRWRVIDCKDGLQWVLQRRDAAAPHRGVWRGIRHHLTRKNLIASCVALAGVLDGPALEALALLPEKYPRGPA